MHTCKDFKVISFVDRGKFTEFHSACIECGATSDFTEANTPRWEPDREYAIGYAHACGYHD